MTAGDIKVLSTHAVLEAMGELVPQFEHMRGNQLSFSYDPANVIKRRIKGGVAFDVAIVTRPVIDDLAAKGEIMPDTCIDIGRCGLGVSVRKGAPKPADISTVIELSFDAGGLFQ